MELILKEVDMTPIKFTLNDPRLQVYLQIHQTVDSLIKYETKIFRSIGLTPQMFEIIRVIKNLPAPVIEHDIAYYVDRSTTRITIVLDRMERKGLVERVRVPKDRRVIKIIITPKADKAYKKGYVLASTLISEILVNLTTTEIQSFNLILEKILDNTFIIRTLEDKVKIIKPIQEKG
jgi:DNA-binding MarR family transcriptional regulator